MTDFRSIEKRAGEASRKLAAEFGQPIPQAYRYFLAYLTGLKVDLDAAEKVVKVVRGQHAGHKARFLKVAGRAGGQFDCANYASLDAYDKATK